jgi:hypothetical protein
VMAEQNERMAQRRRRTAGTKPVDPHACDRYAVPVPLPSSRAHWRLPGGIAAIPSGDSNSRAPRVLTSACEDRAQRHPKWHSPNTQFK